MTKLTKEMGDLHEELIVKIAKRLYATQKYAYLCVDKYWTVIDVSENLEDFGFTSINIGSQAADEIDFLVGLDFNSSIELPMLSSPTRIPIRVSLLPSESWLAIVIADARDEFQQQSQLQQKANENQLLLDKQNKLTAQLKAAQQQLQAQNAELLEAARLQNSFLSGVSHEFRTPLTSIIGYTDLLAKSGLHVDHETAVEYLASVRRSSKHLLSLIENLLDHGKLDSNQINFNIAQVDLAELLSDVAILLGPMAAVKNIELLAENNFPENTSVMLDDSRLRQCLINIVGNAINYTDKGSVKLIAGWQKDQLQIKVVDTGLGISESDLGKIKQPFWQVPDTGKQGTGLGLTITERIIEMMGGSLQIESELGVGTTVSFDVMAPVSEQTKTTDEMVGVPANTALNILLAEDDEDIAMLVTAMLEEQGANIQRVENGQRAVKLAKDEQFDLVLMDINMPVLDGYAATKAIRSTDKKIPIVMMTASRMESDQAKAEALGCDAYLVKPVQASDIFTIANQLIN